MASRRAALLGLAWLAVGAAADGARAADDPALVCFGTAHRGVVCLKDGAWRVFDRRSGHLPADRVSDLAACDGRVVALVGGAVAAYDGKRWTAPLRPPRGRAERLVCDSYGDWWLGFETEVARWDGDAWRYFGLAAMAGGERAAAASFAGAIVRDMAAGPGALWVVFSGGRAARLADGRWTGFRPGAGLPEGAAFARAAVDARGEAWLPAGEAILRLGAGGAARVAVEAGGVDALAFDRQGRLWLAAGARLAAVQYGRVVAEHAAPHALRALAIDSAGAVWLASEFGVARFADGAFEFRQMHNADLPDNDVRAVAVIGAPAPPPPPAEPRAGALAGRLVWPGGQPAAEALVAICAATGLVLPALDASPCEGRPLAAERNADGEGRFVFLDIPAGNYRLAVRGRPGGAWRIVAIEPERLRVPHGRDVQLGEIVLF